MATIKIEIVAGAQTYTLTKTITGPHLTRMIAAERVIHNMTGSQTDAQVATALFDAFFRDTRQAVKAVETQQAADTALGGVTEIDLT